MFITSTGNFLGYQIFTADGTWIKPAGCKTVIVEGVGAGGAGGGNIVGTFEYNGGGGGAGGYFKKLIDVSSVSDVNVTVGANGAGIVGASGSAGTHSAFGHYCKGHGGQGGSVGNTPAAGGYFFTGGAGGDAEGGDINISGQAGQIGRIVLSEIIILGSGGNSILGFGGQLQSYSSPGINATGFGAGGSGSASVPNPVIEQAGGNGAPGIVIVYQYS